MVVVVVVIGCCFFVFWLDCDVVEVGWVWFGFVGDGGD